MITINEVLGSAGLKLRSGVFRLPSWVERVKIDVGLSENAPQSKVWLEADPGLMVIGVEPLKANVSKLRSGQSEYARVLDPQLIGERFFLVEAALAPVPLNTVSLLQFFVTAGDAGCSSLLRPREHVIDHVERVPAISLESLLEAIPPSLACVDHIKTDCQGSDLAVLRSAGRRIRRALAVTFEADNRQYESAENSPVQGQRHLENNGFSRLNGNRTNHVPLPILNLTEDPTFVQADLVRASRRRNLFLFQEG